MEVDDASGLMELDDASGPMELDDASDVFKISNVVKIVKSFESFEDMGIKCNILRGIYNYGFIKPSTIQQLAIVPIITGRNAIVLAQPGTGKTSMIAISVCQIIDTISSNLQAVILSPTKELAAKTTEAILAIGGNIYFRTHSCDGGTSVGKDITKLQNGVHVMSGTPSSVCDMIKRKKVRTQEIKIIILDEFDEVLSRGFKEQIFEVCTYLPLEHQVVLISATLPNEILKITSNLMKNPVYISAFKCDDGRGINQFFVDVEKEDWKFNILCDLLNTLTIKQTVIFCNTKCKVDWLTAKMRENNFPVLPMDRYMPQQDQDAIMGKFLSCQNQLLITTDVWTRQLDVQKIPLVINYDLPNNEELYIHRIGRSGRFGRKGVTINFVKRKSDDIKILGDIEQYYCTKIKQMPDIAEMSKLLI